MLRILQQRAEVAEAQAAFRTQFENAGESKTIRAGHPGETYALDGVWVASEGMWVGFRVLRNRYWNAFGLGLHSSNSICCEINFPIEGRNEQVAGALAKDEHGTVWVLHRGRIGGGKRGVSRALFEKHFKGKWVNAEGNPFALVGGVGQIQFVKHVAEFIRNGWRNETFGLKESGEQSSD